MRKSQLVTVAFIGLCLLFSTSSSARKWTLQECLAYAATHNISVKQKAISRKSAHEDLLQSKAALLPSLTASTSQGVSYTPFIESGRATVANGYVQNSIDKVSYNGVYAINYNWTIWNGNQNHLQIRQNKLLEQQAGLDSAITANSIQEQIAQIYVQILYTAEAVKVNQQSLEWSKANEERGKTMLEVGSISKSDLSLLTAQRASDEYNVVAQQSNLQNYTRQLKALLQLTNEESFEVEVPDNLSSDALQEIPGLLPVYEQALTRRPEIAGQELAIKSNELNVKMAKAQRYPTIALTGGANTNMTTLGSGAYGTQLKQNLGLSSAVSVSFPIFDNRQAKTAVNKAKLSLESSQLELDNQRTQLYSTIENYWIQANTNQAKYKSALVNSDSQQTSYEMLSEQFRLGLKNIVELREGMNNLITAKQNELESKYLTLYNIQMLEFYKDGEIK